MTIQSHRKRIKIIRRGGSIHFGISKLRVYTVVVVRIVHVVCVVGVGVVVVVVVVIVSFERCGLSGGRLKDGGKMMG